MPGSRLSPPTEELAPIAGWKKSPLAVAATIAVYGTAFARTELDARGIQFKEHGYVYH